MNHNNLDNYQIVKECELQLAGAKIELSPSIHFDCMNTTQYVTSILQ